MPKRKVKAVVFDAGGVLVLEDNSKTRLKNTKKLLQEFHKEPDYTSANTGKISLSEMFRRMKGRGTLSIKEVGELKTFILKSRKLNKELRSFGASLKRRGVKTGILSNNSRTVFDTWNKTLHFTKGFEPNVRVSARVKLVKPGREIFLMMTKLLKVQPEEMIFVDDRVSNVTGARKVGIHAIHFKGSNNEVIRQIKKLVR